FRPPAVPTRPRTGPCSGPTYRGEGFGHGRGAGAFERPRPSHIRPHSHIHMFTKKGAKKRAGAPEETPTPKKNRGSDLLSHPHHRSSTIGAGRLNDRVRKGSGCDPPAITTAKQKDPQTHR